jgi:hypothetical protein
VLRFEPSTWNAWIWILHAIGALYVLGFLVYWFRFGYLERRVAEGPEAMARFNRAIEGFPAAFYAKMLAKKPYEEDASGPRRRRH